METNSQKRQHSKFNPPLKKTVPLSGNTSCSSATSWSLPPTQTHTVLSYCEQEELQSQEKCSATKHEAVGQTSRKSLVRSNRKYDYGISTNKTTRRPVQYHPKTCTGAGSNVYDYCLTPSKQVRLQRCKRKRTKEQIEIDRTVLHHIATIRTEIQIIRNQYSKQKQYSTPAKGTNNYLTEE